ncbi:hypothetical protein HMPREF0044_0177 [Gleimia coleocanis DSM 15436]|uniref:Uncharacterized protein n=1 Tax=Gleimia coleocanis DSM 15436 TaxID=525245 RepID=C0VYD7_9ACTO|nr:hypothetical protein HMPREF0044_0177 [Gleimia coleocanis DSM 15436]
MLFSALGKAESEINILENCANPDRNIPKHASTYLNVKALAKLEL